MYFYKLLVLCVLYCTCFAEENVLELTDDNFKRKINELEFAFVMFYIPGCKSCKEFTPKFDKLAQTFKEKDPPVPFFKVDCTDKGKKTCDQYSEGAIPDLRFFRKEKPQPYFGDLRHGAISKFLLRQFQPNAVQLFSVKEFEDFINEDEHSIVCFFKRNSDLKTMFLNLTEDMNGQFARFAYTESDAVFEKYGFIDVIVLFRPKYLHIKFEEDVFVYNGEANKEAVLQFLEKNFYGLVGHRKRVNKDDFVTPLIVAYYNVDFVTNPQHSHYWRNRIFKVAQQYNGSVNFAISSINEFKAELKEFGLTEFIKENEPLILGRKSNERKYLMNETFSVQAFDKFVNDFVNNKTKRFLKSAPIPKTNHGLIKIAVLKNFDEIVKYNGKDTLIYFYSPKCGVCRKFTSVFEELAVRMKNEDVAIVKMDVLANDIPPTFYVPEYPTFYWLPKFSKDEPQAYTDEYSYDVNVLVKFIAGHATSELKGYDREGNPKMVKVEL